MLTQNQQLKFFCLRSGLLSAKDLECWIYSDTSLENTIGADAYLDLISIKYETISSNHEVLKVVEPYYSEAKYLEWNLKELMRAIIARPQDVHIHIAHTYGMYCRGYDFLQKIGLSFGLPIEDPSRWEKLSPDEQHTLIESFYPAIKEDAHRVLACLNTQKITITGWDDFGLNYLDNRTAKEKKLMSPKDLNMDNLFVRVLWKWFKIPIYT